MMKKRMTTIMKMTMKTVTIMKNKETFPIIKHIGTATMDGHVAQTTTIAATIRPTSRNSVPNIFVIAAESSRYAGFLTTMFAFSNFYHGATI